MTYDDWKTYDDAWDVVDTSFCDHCKGDHTLCRVGEHPFYFEETSRYKRSFEFCCETCRDTFLSENIDEEDVIENWG